VAKSNAAAFEQQYGGKISEKKTFLLLYRKQNFS